MRFHTLHTDIAPPPRFTYPMCYEPHPLCLMAAIGSVPPAVSAASVSDLQKQLEFQEDHLFALRQMESDFDEIRRKLEPQLDELDHSEPKDADSILTRLLGYCMKLCQNAYSENKIIDAILYAKVRRAQEQDIDIHVQVMVPQTLPIRDADLIAVCVNLLDNAIEECMRLPKEQRWISFSAAVKKNFLILTAENAKREEASVDFARGKTSKEDAQMHGYGLKVIRRTAAEFDVVDVADWVAEDDLLAPPEEATDRG